MQLARYARFFAKPLIDEAVDLGALSGRKRFVCPRFLPGDVDILFHARTRLITRYFSLNHRRLPLLQNMDQLVCQQSVPSRRLRTELPGRKVDVLAVRERVRTEICVERGSACVSMDPQVSETVAQS